MINDKNNERLTAISKMLSPILRYGKCGFDKKMDAQGFVLISTILQMKRFRDLDTTKNCIVTIVLREKSLSDPRYETNIDHTSIRATTRNLPNEANDTPCIAPSLPKSCTSTTLQAKAPPPQSSVPSTLPCSTPPWKRNLDTLQHTPTKAPRYGPIPMRCDKPHRKIDKTAPILPGSFEDPSGSSSILPLAKKTACRSGRHLPKPKLITLSLSSTLTTQIRNRSLSSKRTPLTQLKTLLRRGSRRVLRNNSPLLTIMSFSR